MARIITDSSRESFIVIDDNGVLTQFGAANGSDAAPPAASLAGAATAPLPTTAVFPTGGLGVALDPNGSLPLTVRQKLAGNEFFYGEIQSSASITAASEATANIVITADAITFDGQTTVWVEFDASRIDRGTTSISIVLFDAFNGGAAGSIGILGSTVQSGLHEPFHRAHRFMPTAGTHVFSVRAFVDAGTGSVVAGAGGVGAAFPSHMRIVKA